MNKLFLLILCFSIGFTADSVLPADNKYFTISLPDKWVVIESGGKDNQMMFTVYDRSGTGGSVGASAFTIFADWDGLDPNQYLVGEFNMANNIKWVNFKNPSGKFQWWGIKAGSKYILSFHVNDGVDAANPIYYSVINTLLVK